MNLSPFHPRKTEKVLGNQDVLDALRSLYVQDTLAPCWLLVGQRGIGKATLAYQFAREVLSNNPKNSEGLSASLVSRQIAVGSYPNLLTVEKAINEDGEEAKEISVSEARKVLDFLHQSPAIPGWRIVIIDAVDELSRSASNALLKILEEPPLKTLILLVCHSLGQVLPTIRSRCQKLHCKPLTLEGFANLEEESVEEELLPYVRGSLGFYRSLISVGGMTFLKKIETATKQAKVGQLSTVQKFADEVSKNPDQYKCFLWLIEQYVYQSALNATSDQAYWVKVYEKLSKFLADAKATHLDKNQLMLSCFLMIENPDIY